MRSSLLIMNKPALPFLPCGMEMGALCPGASADSKLFIQHHFAQCWLSLLETSCLPCCGHSESDWLEFAPLPSRQWYELLNVQ
jgi:hypothetical protein